MLNGKPCKVLDISCAKVKKMKIKKRSKKVEMDNI
jgi:hypothetical protein